MKALLEPLVLRKLTLATPEQMFADSKTRDEAERKLKPLQAELDAFIAPFSAKLYDDRVAMLPADVQAIIRKPERQRSAAEQKIADNYFPFIRIDEGKFDKVMTPTKVKPQNTRR